MNKQSKQVKRSVKSVKTSQTNKKNTVVKNNKILLQSLGVGSAFLGIYGIHKLLDKLVKILPQKVIDRRTRVFVEELEHIESTFKDVKKIFMEISVKSKVSTNTLDKLPTEILLNILEKLPTEDIINSCMSSTKLTKICSTQASVYNRILSIANKNVLNKLYTYTTLQEAILAISYDKLLMKYKDYAGLLLLKSIKIKNLPLFVSCLKYLEIVLPHIKILIKDSVFNDKVPIGWNDNVSTIWNLDSNVIIIKMFDMSLIKNKSNFKYNIYSSFFVYREYLKTINNWKIEYMKKIKDRLYKQPLLVSFLNFPESVFD